MYFQLPRTGPLGWLFSVTVPRNIHPYITVRGHLVPPLNTTIFSLCDIHFFPPSRQQWLEARWLSFTLPALSPFIYNPSAGQNISWVAPFSLFLHWPVKSSYLGAVLIILKAPFSHQHELKTRMPAKDTIQQSLPTTLMATHLACSKIHWAAGEKAPVPGCQPVSSSLPR